MSKKNIRVLQLIDTLTPGGAERMAVNIANALREEVEGSYLCCTRKEGLLKEELKSEVTYLFAEKKYSLDLKALLKVRNFIKKEKIRLVHAHGTSWFMGVLLKLSGCHVKLVWHDHYGNRPRSSGASNRFLIKSSGFFQGIIAVNEELRNWWEQKAKTGNIVQLNNFVLLDSDGESSEIREKEKRFRILCIANFREPKGHFNLLKAFRFLSGKYPDLDLVLVGKGYNDPYSQKMKKYISEHSLKTVQLVSGEHRLGKWLATSHLGVLASDSEGLPLALLEYGTAGLPVVCTTVGECKEVTGDKAILVPPGDPEALAGGIKEYYLDPERRKADALVLQERVKRNYSREAVITELLEFYIKLSRN